MYGHSPDDQDANPIIKSIDYESISSSSELKVVSTDYPFQNKEIKAIVSLGSCNGLICLGICSGIEEENNYICIWNPSTGEYSEINVELPDFLADSTYYSRYGFGYDSNIDDYKLVRFTDYKNLCIYITQVYTLRSNSWKTIHRTNHYKFPDQLHKRLPGVLINWSGKTTTQGSLFSDVIVCFDINSEILRDVPFPEKIKKSLHLSNAHTEVVILGDRLGVVFYFKGMGTDVWVMQDYGVRESWTKVFTTDRSIMTRDPILKPIWCFQNGDILVYANGNLSICDSNNNGDTKKVLLRGVNMSRCLESYVESLVSLGSGKYVQKTMANGSKKRQRLR